MEVEKEHIYFTYPTQGGEVALATGKYVADFEKGRVRGPGTTDTISNNLRSSAFKFCKSLFIKTDQDITISLEGVGASAGYFTVYAGGKFRLNGVLFTRVTLNLGVQTRISIFASTSKDASFGYEKEFLTDHEVINAATGAVAVDALDLQVANNLPPIYTVSIYCTQATYIDFDVVATAASPQIPAGGTLNVDRRVETRISVLQVAVGGNVTGMGWR